MSTRPHRDRAPLPPPSTGDAPGVPVVPAPAMRKSVYLVSFDLHDAHHDDAYDVVESQLGGLGRTVRILHSQFLVQSERSANDVAAHVAEVLDADDHLFVAAVSDDMAWRRLAMGEERAARWKRAARRQ